MNHFWRGLALAFVLSVLFWAALVVVVVVALGW